MASKQDRRFMQRAINEARAALKHKDVPVGAVAVDRNSGEIVGRGHNQRELLQDPTAHAEMLALTAAAARYGTWRLLEVTLYVTLEPCVMCAGACILARIPRLVYGAPDPKAGAHVSVLRVLQNPSLNHRIAVESGVLAEESAKLLQEFFAQRRSGAE